MNGTDLVVAYDIGDDGRRERVSRLLCGYGPRVQLSVFECLLPSTTPVDRLAGQLTALIDTHDDQVRPYRVPSLESRVILGRRRLEERQDFWII